MDFQKGDIDVKNKLEAEQLFKISRFKETIKRTRPHKHDAYFELIYLSEGAGFHWIDTQKIQITPPMVFFLSGQLHYWEMTSIPKGYVMLFREGFFDFVRQNSLLNLVRALEDVTYVQLNPDENLEFIFEEMEKEYKNPSSNSVELIQGYLQVVLVKMLRYREQLHHISETTSTDQVYRKFLSIIHYAQPISNLKVNEVAEQLNVSPQHLNTIVRKASGKSASQLISEQVILEAKRYLLHSDKNVSEIAFSLNFSDPSHFVKYFRKLTGETPQAFRSRYFQ
ncbi:MAG: helix-turn-helix domain-containing protein [Cyclobacteriaceae bacterium]|nr:helix-turn-helix domain-containing protein [Cyclobacteriaceae bacterium]